MASASLAICLSSLFLFLPTSAPPFYIFSILRYRSIVNSFLKKVGEKMGRPRTEIDAEQFEKLCDIQCTLDEIASFFRCSPDTIERWCKRTYKEGFAVVYKKHSAGGKISLRRSQFRLAEKSASMAIWLGKQYLGQRDELAIDGGNNELLEAIANLAKRTDK